MNESPPSEPEPQPESTDSAQPMGLLARMMNVFAVPGEVFDHVKHSPNAPSSWVVPLLVACAVAAGASVTLFSQDSIVQQVHHMRAVAMDEQVEAGKLSREQADQAMEMTEKFSTPLILGLGGAVGGTVAALAGLFWWALMLWLVALLFVRTRIPYAKALEVTGLASLITTLAVVVQLLLQIKMGNIMATPSLALFVSDYDPANPLHMALGAVNPLKLWMVLVLGIGLARLTEIAFSRAALLMVACYCLQTSALVLMGAGMAML